MARTDGLTLAAVALADGRKWPSAECQPTGEQPAGVQPQRKELWAARLAFLYDLKLSAAPRQPTDRPGRLVLRAAKVTIDGSAILINGKPVFQRPCSIRASIPRAFGPRRATRRSATTSRFRMAAGFNGARLHQKVFEPRFLYWADKLGYLVWGEFPNWGLHRYGEAVMNLPVIDEWTEIVRRDRNHPAIIGLCPFNETGEAAGPLQNTICQRYPGDRSLAADDRFERLVPRPAESGCFGRRTITKRIRPCSARLGRRLQVRSAGAAVSRSWRLIAAFRSCSSEIRRHRLEYRQRRLGLRRGPKDLSSFYARFRASPTPCWTIPNMFGYCYTQLTDVEQEHNGLYYYNRRPKFDVERLHKIQSRPAAYEKTPPCR